MPTYINNGDDSEGNGGDDVEESCVLFTVALFIIAAAIGCFITAAVIA